MECPNCKTNLTVAAMVPASQTMFLNLESEGEMLAAETIGGVITNTSELLASLAKEAGTRVQAFVSSMEQEPFKVKIGFKIVALASLPNSGKNVN